MKEREQAVKWALARLEFLAAYPFEKDDQRRRIKEIVRHMLVELGYEKVAYAIDDAWYAMP
jgi:hypothetical protein